MVRTQALRVRPARGNRLASGGSGHLVCFSGQWQCHLSNEKRAPGCLGYIGDEQLPSYLGIISKTIIRIPIKNKQDSMESKAFFFFVAHLGKAS